MKAIDVLEQIVKYERNKNEKHLKDLTDTFLAYRTKQIKIYDNSSLGDYLKQNKKQLEDFGYKFLKTPNFLRNYFIISVE